jgi:hypothetical protein
MCYIAPMIHLLQCARPQCDSVLHASLRNVHICRFGHVYNSQSTPAEQPQAQRNGADFDINTPNNPCGGCFNFISESETPPSTITLKSTEFCADCFNRIADDDAAIELDMQMSAEERNLESTLLWSRWADVLMNCEVGGYILGQRPRG